MPDELLVEDLPDWYRAKYIGFESARFQTWWRTVGRVGIEDNPLYFEIRGRCAKAWMHSCARMYPKDI